MKTLAIIPARGGSKRLLGKNLMELGGKSLVEHSIAFAKANSEHIRNIALSTDDPIIAEHARKEGVEVIMRPREISGDHSPTIDALRHILEQLAYATVDTVVVLQPTNPLRPAGLLDEAMNIFNEKKVNSLFTCSPMSHKLGSIKNDKFISRNYSYGQRSQDLEPLYFENGLLYIASADTIRSGKLIDEDHHAMVVDHEYAHIDIDHQEDLDYARYIWQRDNR